MKPWIVIPVHNRRALTLACVQNLDTVGAFEQAHVLVVDDGSSDGTAEALQEKFPQVEILRGSGDLWWTGAISAGMSHAFAHGAGAVCWLNDDCHLHRDTLEKLQAAALAHPRSLIAPTCLDQSTRKPIPAGGFIGRSQVGAIAEPTLEVEGVSGFCLWVTREVWQTVGQPDATNFPHYYGDTAYMLAAKSAGCRVMLLRDARVTLVNYRERASTPGEYAAEKIEAGSRANLWRETFCSKRSPFRLATMFAYLRLRYGLVLGAALGTARFCAWQASWLFGRKQRQVA